MEKELLLKVETAIYHRGILFGFNVRFHSDHKNLSFENFKSERVRRWRLLLEEFNFEFQYTPGKRQCCSRHDKQVSSYQRQSKINRRAYHNR